MRVVLSTYRSRGDVQPLVGLAVLLRALGAEVRVCAPPEEELTELLARVGMPLVPAFDPQPSAMLEAVAWCNPPSYTGHSKRRREILQGTDDVEHDKSR
jgi:vancomycin aglycone glucosyltransferase